MTETVSVAFATVPTTVRPAAAPWSGDVAAPAPRSPASVVIGPPPALPGSTLAPRPTGGLTHRQTGDLTPRPTGGLPAIRGRSGCPSLPSRLLELLRLGRTRARGLTAQDKRILAYFAVALVVAMGGQVDLATAAPLAAPAALPAGAHVATTTQVLDLARAQIGTVEAPDGSTPYHGDYGLAADQPWCAIFLWDVFQDAGGADSIHPRTAFTPTLASWFRDRGQWTATPTVGALVFYDWPADSRDRIQHVGIVESFTPTTITTIEGNTSNSNAGSQDDGDGVWRRTRPRDASIVGYGLPTYGLAP
jgi:hypothetical protein